MCVKLNINLCVVLYISHCHSHPRIMHTSIGKLVSMSVDNPKYYTLQQRSSTPPPPLFPIPASGGGNQAVEADADADEKTMLWKNIATLFAKSEQNESDIQAQNGYVYGRLTRGTDDLYQELQDMKIDIAQLQCEQDDQNKSSETATDAHPLNKKMKKYVAKKCKKVRETVSYGAYNADNEIFAYIDKIRAEFEAKTKTMEDEITRLNAKLDESDGVYDLDYEMFVERENALMAKLKRAVKMTETLSRRIKDNEDIMMRQLQELREYTQQQQYRAAGDLREEFTRAICNEVEMESKVSAQLVQSVKDEMTSTIRSTEETCRRIKALEDFIDDGLVDWLRAEFSGDITSDAERVSDQMTDLVTRSNEYHTARYVGVLGELENMRETHMTLKQSIGMVDAELSDVKETVEFLKDEVAESSNDVYDMKEEMSEWKDDVYREMDRDYYDLKDYVKHRIHRHERQKHATADADAGEADALQMIVTEYAAEEPERQQPPHPPAEHDYDEHVIIIDADAFISDNEEDEIQHT